MTITFEVTATHIEVGQRSRGARSRCQNCPVALAMTEALGRSVRVVVDDWRFADDGRHYPLPPDLREYVRTADHGKPGSLEPRWFTVEIPDLLAAKEKKDG